MLDGIVGIGNKYSNEVKPVQVSGSELNPARESEEAGVVKDIGKSSETKEENQGKQGNQGDLEKKVKTAVEQANEDARVKRTGFEFTYHEVSNKISIKIYDKKTKEVIKEIPPEKTIEMVEKMWELSGLLVDEKM
ncbi:flagellar protein FlaG [Anaeromicropila populeti]|uniref:FlaG protein n=1 Tax=Anaeromicropila populeti TaxID=37658 RepID=A0A1I6HWZ2_9FIRM|nr:flagellar protein FlaG [Anaeromicropila populeti]SFR58937.1 FlaG protein [Anaeromicropila populeti]